MALPRNRAIQAVTILSALILLSALIPAGAANPESKYLVTGSCVGVDTNPPDVTFGKCGPGLKGSTFSSQATGQDLDVHVTWDIEQAGLTQEDVDHIQVLRGDDPDTMTPITEPLAPSTTSYLDEGALITAPGETWYQTHVVLDDGTVIKDDPVHIGDYETTIV